MSKVDAPAPEPAEEKKPTPRRGKYIDFAPRRPKAAQNSAAKPVVKKTTTRTIVHATIPAAPAEGLVTPPEVDEVDEIDDLEAQLDSFIADEPEEEPEPAEITAVIEEEQTEFIAEPVKSPFLENYEIEKRPLSDKVPEKQQVASQEYLEPTPKKEFSEKDLEEEADEAPADTPVVPAEEEGGSKLGMILTIIITILLGAGVGVFAYLAFFR